MSRVEPDIPAGVDPSMPSSARMYDYYLGGAHNLAVDRQAAEQVLVTAPWTRDMAINNRAFLRRAVTWVVREAGVSQFLDLGSGVPTAGNVHEVAQDIDPAAKVVYVDRDPVAVAHSRMLLAGDPRSKVVAADIREPATVLTHANLRSTLDLSEPVALLMVSVLPFVTDSDSPDDLIGAYLDELVHGSYLVISHASLDGAEEELRAKVLKAAEVYAAAGQPVTLRPRTRVLGWFAGLELVEPGVVPLSDWHPDPGDVTFYDMLSFGGVGRVAT